MYYKIMPIDTFFFRGGMPFDAGVNFHTESLFPPYPSAYAGALRRGEKVAARSIKIGWNGMMIKDQPIFPRPLDMNFMDEETLQKMELHPEPLGNQQLPYILAPKEVSLGKKLVKNSGQDMYITQDDLSRYLFDQEDLSISTFNLDKYIVKEPHIGIAIDPETQTTIDGQWYIQEKIRLQSTIQLVVEAEGELSSEEGLIKLGGANKVASIQPLQQSFPIMEQKIEDESRYFKLYLSTPAIFKQGWLPRWIDLKTMEGSFSFRKRKVKVKLMSAAIGKPFPIGGFETVKNRPKALHLAVPAGSVYFFEIIEGTLKDVIHLMHGKNMSDYRETLGFDYPWYTRTTYCDRGFGYSFIGRVTKEQGGVWTDV